jgi:streptogramin lyase
VVRFIELRKAAKVAVAACLLTYSAAGLGSARAEAGGAVSAAISATPGSYSFERMTPKDSYIFKSISGVAADDQGNVYVTDWYAGNIIVYNAAGEQLALWDGGGDAQYQLNGVAVDEEGFLYTVKGQDVYKLELDASFGLSVKEIWHGEEIIGSINGLAVDSATGRIYVTDDYLNKIWLLEAGQPVSNSWDGYETSEGGSVSFGQLSSIAVNAAGQVYVAVDDNGILKLDNTGKWLDGWNGEEEQVTDGGASNSNIVDYIGGIAVDSLENVYITDTYNNRVIRLDSEWKAMASGSEGRRNGQFDGPQSIAVTKAGIVYVADRYNNRLQLFNSGLEHAGTWGSWGTDAGQFYFPENIAVDGAGNVYVADQGNGRVQKFDDKLRFLEGRDGEGSSFWPYGLAANALGQLYITSENLLIKYDPDDGKTAILSQSLNEAQDVAVDREGHIYVANTVGHTVEVFDAAGEKLNSFSGEPDYGVGFYFRPQSIAVDSERGIVYTTDSRHVQTFTLEGTQVDIVWGGIEAGSDESSLGNISDIALDSVGNVYITDTSNNQIHKYAPDGQKLESWGSKGSGAGAFNALRAVAVDRHSGDVYVTDNENHRMQKFEFLGNKLRALAISAGHLSPVFDPSNEEYTAEVATEVTEVTFTPAAYDEAAQIEVNGERVGHGTASSGIRLAEGVHTPISVKVTAADGQVKTYRITVFRAAAPIGGGGGTGGEPGTGGGDGGTGGEPGTGGGDGGTGGEPGTGGGDGGTGGEPGTGGGDGSTGGEPGTGGGDGGTGGEPGTGGGDGGTGGEPGTGGGDGGTGGEPGTGGGDGGTGGGSGGSGTVVTAPNQIAFDTKVGGIAGQALLKDASATELKDGRIEAVISSNGVDALLAITPRPQTVTIGIAPTAVEQVVIKIPASIVELASNNAQARLELQTAFGTLFLPLSELVKQVDTKTDTIGIVLRYFSEGSSEAQRAKAALQFNKAVDINSPVVGVELAVTSKDGSTKPLSYKGNYAELVLKISQSGSDSTLIREWAGVSVGNQADSLIVAVPTLLNSTANEGLARLKLKKSGIYTVWKHKSAFGDAADAPYAFEAIQALSNKFVLRGVSEGRFQPLKEITRAQYVTMILQGLGIAPVNSGATSFADMKEGQWYYDAVMTAYELGMVTGYEDGAFRPAGVLNRQEMIAILYNTLKVAENLEVLSTEETNHMLEAYSDASSVAPWAREAVAYALKHGIMNGTASDKLSPLAEANRAQGAVLIYNMMQRLELINK